MPQVTMKEAVAAAKSAIRELYTGEKLEQLALEEIELVVDGYTECWAVTLGFFRPKSVSVKPGAIGAMLQPAQVENRDYKKLFIDSKTGEFKRMEIRPAP